MATHAENRRVAKERRTRVLFQPKQIGRFWYIVKWPEGEFMPTKPMRTFEEAAALSKTYQAA